MEVPKVKTLFNSTGSGNNVSYLNDEDITKYRTVIFQIINQNGACHASHSMPVSTWQLYSNGNYPCSFYAFDGASHCNAYVQYVSRTKFHYAVTSPFGLRIFATT